MRTYENAITYKSGNVFYLLPDGGIAVNSQGMEMGFFASFLKMAAKHVGKDSTIRNAETIELQALGGGAWYIMEKAQKEKDG